jgi:hypothetical protein
MKLIESYLCKIQKENSNEECNCDEGHVSQYAAGEINVDAAQADNLPYDRTDGTSAVLGEAGFEGKPHGWHQSSVNKFSNTLSKHIGVGVQEKGWFEKCVNKMIGPMKNKDHASRFCAALRDQKLKSTMWRGKGKTEKEGQKDVAQNKNVTPLK